MEEVRSNKTALQILSELIGNSPVRLPIELLTDVNKRTSDWLASGRGEDDPYIWQQVRYAKNYIAATFYGQDVSF